MKRARGDGSADGVARVAQVDVKVVPGSSRDAVAGWLGGALKVRVRAPAERGRANTAVVKLVAEALGVSARDARIVKGATSPRKVLEIEGLSPAELERRLQAIAARQ